MTTMTISLPVSTARLIDGETIREGFSTRSEFIRNVLRRYFSGGLQFEKFAPRPFDEIKLELAKTGKYSEKFIRSVTKGLAQSTAYAS